MKKKQGIITLVAMLIVTVLLGITVIKGWGPTGSGAMKNIRTGLDLSGGVSITYQAKEKNPSDADMDDTRSKLQKRVEQYSTEAQVYRQGDRRLIIEIPGATDATSILEELGKPGSLQFKDPDGKVVLEGSDIKDAQGVSTQDSNSTKQYVVELALNNSGKEKFAEATKANIGKQISIVYDGDTISSPTVNSEISDGKCEITGMGSIEEAKNLASMIRIGSLSIQLEEIYSNVVAAQLGSDALSTSLLAGVIGVILIVLFMIAVYRIPGLAAGWALILYTFLMLGFLNGFDVTLTLPGIAGIILSIGMAVDANVIIYARIREEITGGRSIRSSITVGFKKAFSAILDGNVTSLIAAIILYILGTGTIRGFAITFGMGIALSMFSAMIISRVLVLAMYGVGADKVKYYGEKKHIAPLKIVEKKKFIFVLSTVLILLLPAGLLIGKVQTGKMLNYSLDFMGGTSTTVDFNENMSMKELEKEVYPVVHDVTGDANIMFQKVVNSDTAIIKTRELSVKERKQLNTSIEDKFGVKADKITAENISATMSSDMRNNAIIAVCVAVVCMLIYIWFRFKDIRFASSAVLALVHDIMIVIAFYALFRYSVGNTFIAVLLTILGYSVNNTIVIFDRIRELLPIMKREPEDVIVNKAVTETMTRTMYSSLTTIITVLVLFILGVPSVREFSLPILVGLVIGTYTSVFLTGPLWFIFRKYVGRKKGAKPQISKAKDQK